ncbi:thioesterase-like superfamily-domain-containing protein [Xylaria flabelliformis]|nr:thioesterase-like superfamily-domain-containing protein [Xylaria flabelliformis]
MAQRPTTESVISVVEAAQLGHEVYHNKGPLIQHPNADVAFGGCVVGQAVSAAVATVPSEFRLCSLQSSFLRPVKASEKVIYHIDRTADGRKSATRVVRATQPMAGLSPCLYIAILSFQRPGNSEGKNKLDYHSLMPNVEGTTPQDVPQRSFQEFGFRLSGSSDELEDPVERRPLPLLLSPNNPSQTRARGFVRAVPLSNSSHAAHVASMVYISDENLLSLVLLTDTETEGISRDMRSLAMTTTLTHQVTFHTPTVKADTWMVCESSRSWVADGRVSLLQQFWDFKSGQLIMTSTQEALFMYSKPSL